MGALLPLGNKKPVKEGGVFLPHPHEFLPPGSLNNAPLFSPSCPAPSHPFPCHVVMEDKHDEPLFGEECALCVWYCGAGVESSKRRLRLTRQGLFGCVCAHGGVNRPLGSVCGAKSETWAPLFLPSLTQDVLWASSAFLP